MYSAVVVGCGIIGSLWDIERPEYIKNPFTHAGAYNLHTKVDLAAGVDIDSEKRNKFVKHWSAPAFTTVEDMLSELTPDFWSICTKAESHFEMVKSAVLAGAKGIWCEKPIAKTLLEASSMVSLCRKAGIPLLINHSRRFDAFHRDIKARIRKGEWGDIERVLIHYVRGIENYGSHCFDIIRFLLDDEIEWVAARDELMESVPDLSLTVNGQTSRGTPFALLPLRRAFYDCFDIDIWGTKGRLTISHLGKEVCQYLPGPSPDWCEPFVLIETKGKFLPGMEGMTLNAISNLIGCVEKGWEPLSSGIDGLIALACIYASKRSVEESGRIVNIKEILENIH